MNLSECNTQWGEEFLNNNNCVAQHHEETDLMSQELMELELPRLDHLPQEATIVPDDFLHDFDCDLFSEINQSLEEADGWDWSARSLLEQPPSQGGTKRRVGRPAKTGQLVVTELPPAGKVTGAALQRARYRRMRDLNNIASQKCRLRK